MPTYTYRCANCGKFDMYQSIKDSALKECPTCGSAVERVIGKNVNIVYKCSGFYCTDTRSPSGTVNNETQKDEPKGENKVETKAETKSDIKSDIKTDNKAVNQ